MPEVVFDLSTFRWKRMREDWRLYPAPPGVGDDLQPLLRSAVFDFMELKAFWIYNSAGGNTKWSCRCCKLKVQTRPRLPSFANVSSPC